MGDIVDICHNAIGGFLSCSLFLQFCPMIQMFAEQWLDSVPQQYRLLATFSFPNTRNNS